MNTKLFITALAAALMLGGCASSGNQQLKNLNVEEARQFIIEGKTNRSEVEAKYGAADSVSFTDSGLEIWTYRYQEATSHASNYIPIVNIFSSGHDVLTKEMVILFNKNNIVERLSVRQSNSTERAGIFGK